MRIEDITSQFDLLYSRWQDGEIDFQRFRRALAFRDAEGNEWRLTTEGEWRKHVKGGTGQGSKATPPALLEPIHPDLWLQSSESTTDTENGVASSGSEVDLPQDDSHPLGAVQIPRGETADEFVIFSRDQKPPARHRWLKLAVTGIMVLLVAGIVTVVSLSKCSSEPVEPVSPTGTVGSVTQTDSESLEADLAATRPLMPTAKPSTIFTSTSPPTWTPSCTPSPSPKPTNTPTPSPRPSNTLTLSPTSRPSDTPTVTPSPTPTWTASPTATTTNTPKPPTNTPSPSPVKPASPRLSGQIVFPLFDPVDQEIDIFVANVTGGNRRLLIENASQPGIDRQLYRFTYRSWKSNNRGLIVQEIKTASPLDLQEGIWRVTESFEAARLALSQDGRDLVYPSKEGSDRQWRLYDVNNEILRRTGQDVAGSAPAWLPDGRLVFNHCQGNACGLFLMRRDGSEYRQLTQVPQDTTPEGSPDGQLVAFTSQRDGNFDIYVMATTGGAVRRLTRHNAHDALPAWSPDGQWIAFISNREDRWAVWAMTPDGTQEQRLFDLGGVPGGCPAHVMEHECGGWAEERIVWIP